MSFENTPWEAVKRIQSDSGEMKPGTKKQWIIAGLLFLAAVAGVACWLILR